MHHRLNGARTAARWLALACLALTLTEFASAATAHAEVRAAAYGYGRVHAEGAPDSADCVSAPSNPESGRHDCATVGANPVCRQESTTATVCRATLYAQQGSDGWSFLGWSGACSGKLACTVVTSRQDCDYERKPPCHTTLYSPLVIANFEDIDEPAVTLVRQLPAGTRTGSTEARFAWSITRPEEQPSSSCTLDGQAVACTPSGTPLIGLADGSHTFAVTATDPSGNSSEPKHETWTVDTTAPFVSFTGETAEGAVFVSGNGTISFTFTVQPAEDFRGASCALDGTSRPCRPDDTIVLHALADGEHELSVTVEDDIGNKRTFLRRWTQQTPRVAITAAPSSATAVARADARLEFSAAPISVPVSYECRLDANSESAWQPCSSPFERTSLADGPHVFDVRAVAIVMSRREAGPAASHTWTIDTTPPDTTLADGPAEGSLSSLNAVAFRLESESGARFECSLDDAAYSLCPATPTLAGLGLGAHVFRARARDAAGNVDATAVMRRWRIASDVDGDGVVAAGGSTGDCDDGDPAIHPGARDLPRNSVDEDCDGNDADYPRMQVDIRHAEKAHGPHLTILKRLVISAIPQGASIRLRCHGTGCRHARELIRPAAGTARLALTGRVRKQRLAPGAVFGVAVTAPGMYGKLLRLRCRDGKPPRARWLSIDPVSGKLAPW